MDREIQKGKVWLAGAGPGDAGLLTVKTKDLLMTCDVIVYDALISGEILSLIPDGKELIYVGKRSGHHLMPQEDINQILLKKVKEGKKVLRLKGGDPFVFGRGGEELELLAKNHIPFEVVPGITSACAVPAYAGIPVTHRDYTSSFHVITGHPRKDGSSQIDFPSLVKLNGTLIFLMGISSMEMILKGLKEAGLDIHTPAAVLEKGTYANQRRVISTVENLCYDTEKAGIKTPAIILVGEVCRLSHIFHWAEDRLLGNRQILVTRPRKRSERLSSSLRELGAQVIEFPAIHTREIVKNQVFEKAMETFGTSEKEEWLVFTSPAGVEVFFVKLLKMEMDMRRLLRGPACIKIAAIGQATAKALKEYGLFPDVVPQVFCGKALGEEIAKKAKADSKVTVVRAEKGSKELIPPLLKAGIKVEDIPLYETIYEIHEQIKEKIEELFEKDEIDAVTFTSASTVKGFVKALDFVDYSRIKAICIGAQTAEEARKYGMQIYISKEASIESMTELIAEELGRD